MINEGHVFWGILSSLFMAYTSSASDRLMFVLLETGDNAKALNRRIIVGWVCRKRNRKRNKTRLLHIIEFHGGTLRWFHPDFAHLIFSHFFFFHFLPLLFLFFAMLILYSSIFRGLWSVCGRKYSQSQSHSRIRALAHTFRYNKSDESIYSVVKNSIRRFFFKRRKKTKKIFLCSFVNALKAPRNTHSLIHLLIHSPQCGCALRCASLRSLLFVFNTSALLNLRELTVFYNVIFICC